MPHIRIRLGYYLTCGTDYAVAAEGPEEIFRIVLELSDNVPEKADLLDKCGDGFARNFFGNTHKKEDINKAILAYESVFHLTPHGYLDSTGSRLNKLGALLYHRFNLVGDLTDISKAILYQQKVICLTPEDDANMPSWLNNLGLSYQRRFEHAGDLADISDAVSYLLKALHRTPEGHANMPSQLDNLGISLRSRFECTGDLADISDAISYKQKAVHLTPDGHANMPSKLSSLGTVTTSKDFRPVLNSRAAVSVNQISILVIVLVCLI